MQAAIVTSFRSADDPRRALHVHVEGARYFQTLPKLLLYDEHEIYTSGP